jgi:hypothetical protein
MAKVYRVVPEELYNKLFNKVQPIEELNYFKDLFPASISNRAQRLLSSLEKVPELSWKSSGEIIVKGKIIPQSHIVDLVSLSVKPLLPKNLNQPGLSEYIDIIKNSNIPRDTLSLPFKNLLTTEQSTTSLLTGAGQDCAFNINNWVSFEDRIKCRVKDTK